MAEELEQKKVEEQDMQVEAQESEVQEEKKPKKERTALLYIQTTKNNTILTLTDMAGNSLSRSSGGQNTKQARLKSSPTIAMFAAKKISEDAKELGITTLYVRIKGQTGETSTSSAAHAIIKSLSRDDFKVLSIMETTKSPRGGPKAGGGRRGRRV
jgi:ribosomal protein S11